MRILIAEDDKDICEIVKIYLTSENYEVIEVHNGQDALEVLSQSKIDLAIFDVMMPKIDGYILTKKVRETWDIPIIILSAKDEDYDKILGLNIGADDYMTKPFNPLELLARVNAHLRRVKKKDLTTKSHGEIVLDLNSYKVYKNNQALDLTATEFKILNMLLSHPNQIYSKSQISQTINPDDYVGMDHTVVVHISNLREKLGLNQEGHKYIKTVKGLGYKFE